jgi:hypothetical protein
MYAIRHLLESALALVRQHLGPVAVPMHNLFLALKLDTAPTSSIAGLACRDAFFFVGDRQSMIAIGTSRGFQAGIG